MGLSLRSYSNSSIRPASTSRWIRPSSRRKILTTVQLLSFFTISFYSWSSLAFTWTTSNAFWNSRRCTNAFGTTTLFSLSPPSWSDSAVRGPPRDTKPDYENIHGPLGKPVDDIFLSVFRDKLIELSGVKEASPELELAPGYDGIVQVAMQMNIIHSNRTVIQDRARQVLIALFPGWMPPWYSVLFSKPFPIFSAQMNAWATYVAGTWLMGECEINDIVLNDGVTIGKNQGLKVKRCRFLEESGCASVCVNSCKIPTQRFFQENMGLPLTMEPDYETYECQFSFGKTPTEETENMAKSIPCLSRCPSAGALRKFHDQKLDKNDTAIGPSCQFMDNEPQS